MSDHTDCGAECGQHGRTIAGYTDCGNGITTIHLTPAAQVGLMITPVRRPLIKTFWRRVWERLFG